MAKAYSSTESDPAKEMVEEAGNAVFLIVPESLVVILSAQAEDEGRRLGEVLDEAVRGYLDEHGSDRVRAFLDQIREAV